MSVKITSVDKIGDPCPDCGVPLTDYNGMPVCADCYERAVREEGGEVLVVDAVKPEPVPSREDILSQSSTGRRIVRSDSFASALNLIAAAQIMAAPFRKKISAPEIPSVPNARQKLKSGSISLEEVAKGLENGDFGRIEGRTLPPGAQWGGHDIQGRGNAAKRRLAQMAKQQEKQYARAAREMTLKGGSGNETSNELGSGGVSRTGADPTSLMAGEGSPLGEKA